MGWVTLGLSGVFWLVLVVLTYGCAFWVSGTGGSGVLFLGLSCWVSGLPFWLEFGVGLALCLLALVVVVCG